MDSIFFMKSISLKKQRQLFFANFAHNHAHAGKLAPVCFKGNELFLAYFISVSPWFLKNLFRFCKLIFTLYLGNKKQN